MAFLQPSVADLSYLHARHSAGRASVQLPGLAPAQRDLTAELQREGAAGNMLRVFLRVRPQLPQDFPLDDEGRKPEPVLETPNNVHLLMHAPKESATYRNAVNGGGKLVHRYTFTHLFRPTTSQQQLFKQTTLNHITEFVNGQSCLVFTYGATNSGKTFTVQGTLQEPGLLPRSLDVIFNSVAPQLYTQLDIQPRAYADVCKVSPREQQAAARLRRHTLQLGADYPAGSSSVASEDSLASSHTYRSQESLAVSQADSTTEHLCSEIENRERETSSVSIANQPNTRFSVWVSYVEIYNETVYDLLEPPSRRRVPLHLGLDKKGNTYVKGVREVHVRSADEACQVVRAGRQNLHFASNRLNHNSSRSHCVFSVKLIRMLDTDNPSVARISMFSVCDLAGCERVEKTLAQGQRMKEAGNINTSLMVLGRCMKAMRQAQGRGGGAPAGGALVPYRDSKLTRLFQSFLTGSTASRVTMIVNVSPSPVVFDETVQVLKFSALAKQVSVQQPEKRRAPTRFSLMARRSVQEAPARPQPLLDATSAEEDQYENLLELVESLRAELIEARREKTSLEANLRKELCEEFGKHMVQIEEDHQKQIQEVERFAERRAEEQLNVVASGLRAEFARKRSRGDHSDTDGETDERQDDLQQEVKVAEERAAAAEQRCQLLEQQHEAEQADRRQMLQRAAEQRSQLAELTARMADATAANSRLQAQLTEAEQQCHRQLEASGDPLATQLGRQLSKLQEELRFKEMDLVEARDLLREGGEEYLQLEATAEQLRLQMTELTGQLAEREEAGRDLVSQAQDMEQLLDARSQRISELELQLQRQTERCTCRLRGLAAAGIPEQQEDTTEHTAELSFGSKLRSLRNKTGTILRQVYPGSLKKAGAVAESCDNAGELAQRQATLSSGSSSELKTGPASQPQQPHSDQSLLAVRAELAEQRKKCEQSEQRVQQLEAELTSHRQQRTEERAAGDRSYQQAAAELEQLKPQLAALTSERDQLAQTAAELEQLKPQLTALTLERDQLAQTAAELEQLKSQLAALTSERDQLSRTATELEPLKSQLAALTSERDQLSREATELEQLKPQLAVLTSERDQLSRTATELEPLKSQLAALTSERDQLSREATELEQLKPQLAALTSERDQLARTAAELEQLKPQLAALTSERDQLAQAAPDCRLAEAQRELADLQRSYKSTLLERNEARADTEVLQRQLKEATPDQQLLQQRDTELQVLQARVAALTREEEAFNILKAELDAKKEELRQNNVVELRAQLERAHAERGHLQDELEKNSNQLVKLNVQLDALKQKLTEKEEDVQKAREDRVRALSMSESTIRRKNDELNREKHESTHLREMMARLTPKSSSSVLASELEAARAENRRKQDHIQQLEAQLRAAAAPPLVEVSAPTPRRAAARATAAARSEEHDEEVAEETPTPQTRPRTRRATKASSSMSVHFADENDDPDSVSEASSSVSRSCRSRPDPSVLAEKQATPSDRAPPARTNKSTSKRKLFKRCSTEMLECSPVEVSRDFSPRKVVTRSLRSRKK